MDEILIASPYLTLSRSKFELNVVGFPPKSLGKDHSCNSYNVILVFFPLLETSRFFGGIEFKNQFSVFKEDFFEKSIWLNCLLKI